MQLRGPRRRVTVGAVLALVTLVVSLHSPAAAVPATAGETVVVAGALRAVVHADPWRLELVDAAGNTVLREASGTGLGPDGTLGFRTPAGWQHATRVESERRAGGAYEAVLATTDPQRRLELRLSPDAEGVIALDALVTGATAADVDAVGMGFQGSGDERYLGFGERSHAVDQRGQVIENYVSDGPYQMQEYPFLNAFVPPWGLRERPDSTYFPIPWLLSSGGYGVLVDNPQTSYFRLGTERAGAWSLEVVTAPVDEVAGPSAPPPDRLRLRFFGGPGPADALRRFTAATGRQPQPQPWAFGPWFQAREDEIAEVQALQEADAPLSVLQTYLHYLPCGEQQGVQAQQPVRTAAAHAAGVAITTYVNPMVCANYPAAFDPARAAGALTRNSLGEPALYRYGASPQDSNLVAQYDFFTEAGEAAYGERLAEALEDGYDGWMEDFGEYTPLDSVSGDGVHGTGAHNPYATQYHCAAHEQTDSSAGIVRYQRSGWTGAAACAPVVWGGDPTTGWGFDGLRSAVRQALSMGTSGVSTWGSDIGGFFAIGRNALSPELLTRWVQLGSLTPVMRTQANGVALPEKDRPQVTDPDQLPNWRRYSKLHTQLFPYLTAAHEEYARSGLPIVRHLALTHPQDEQAGARDDQYLFGPDLLVAPVLDPGVVERELYLPAGNWVDLWRAVRYEPAGGGLDLAAAQVTAGARAVVVPAPLEELPTFVRAGAVLPLLPPEVDTLTDYGSDPGLVRLADRADRLHLLAFPRGASTSALPFGGRLVSTEGDGSWTLGIGSDEQRTYSLQASLATLETSFAPCRLNVDGRPLARSAWSYDAADRSLQAVFTTTAGLLEVRACGSAAASPPGSVAAAGRSLPSTGPTGPASALALTVVLSGLVLLRGRRTSGPVSRAGASCSPSPHARRPRRTGR